MSEPPPKKDEAEDDDEDGEEEEIEFLGKAPKRKDTRITFFHPPLPKPNKKFHPDEKQDSELLR